MDDERVVEAVFTIFTGFMLIIAGMAFIAVFQTLSSASVAPAFAGIAALFGAFVGVRGIVAERSSRKI